MRNDVAIAGGFEKGDRVRWKAGGGKAEGTVERVIRGRAKVGDRTVAATRNDPRYVVKNAATGTTVIRRADSLSRARSRGASARREASAAPVPAPLPTGRRLLGLRLPRLRWIVVALLGATLIGGVAYYFTAVPGKLSDDYYAKAKPAFERVDKRLYVVSETFRSRYFRGEAVGDLVKLRGAKGADIARYRRAYRRQYASDRRDIRRARAAIGRAAKTIDRAESDLTDVDSMPLLDGRGDLGAADTAARNAADYLKFAREHLKRYRQGIAYSEKMLVLDEDVTGLLLDESEASTFESAKAQAGKRTAGLRKVRRKLNRLPKAPKAARPFRFATARGLDLLIEFFDGVKEAYDQVSLDRFDEAKRKSDAAFKQFSAAYGLRFGIFQTSSTLADDFGHLNTLERRLAPALGAEPGPLSKPRSRRIKTNPGDESTA